MRNASVIILLNVIFVAFIIFLTYINIQTDWSLTGSYAIHFIKAEPIFAIKTTLFTKILLEFV